MNSAILDPDVQNYINQNLKTDPTVLILKGVSFTEVSVTEVVEQIEAKSRCEKKLPTWFNQPNIYYPNKLNIEQTSSEATAEYKSRLISGETLIDLTGGFGVDAYYFGKVFKQVTHCELNADLSTIVKYNFEKFKVSNINIIAEDGISFLQNSAANYDWIYVDPSRRHDSKGKVFFLKDCLPNIPEHLDVLWSRSKNILIKTSPLLDISIGLNELENVKTIHIVAVNNEVKELLWVLEHGFSGKVKIKTVNLKNSGSEQFEFFIEDEAQVETIYSEPLTYLYEPNSAIMKSGGFNSLTETFDVKKLHKHSHLYTSEKLILFPGRAFKILKAVPYHKKQIKTLNIQKANLTTRNFPDTVQNIRNLFKIKDGGDDYIFFTTDINNEKIVLVCAKVDSET
ncbi:class I SAM-dependent methyltransferase [Gelidibacter gilvus]|uniref:Class I SAM-dependent methyltransferase n=1 Tax=Gelidibacter gilvus TaxID=59602 RepID=A0A4Q0XHS0_9FLAO|nr:class I SAM-dependent methyltransferase [Gelidibacter gilvus]RXJ51128.1 class I SAM-dependent methyltransferase [Gelidibacter gilvus]